MRGLLVIEIDEWNICGDGKCIHTQLGGEERGSPVFVYDCFHTLQFSTVTDHRDSSTPASNDQNSMTYKRADNAELNDLNGLRRRNHAAVAARSIFDNLPCKVALALFGLFTGVKGPDWFGGMPHRGIVRANHCLSHHANYGHIQSRRRQFIAQRLREQITDLSLAGGATNIQRLSGNLV